LPVRSVSDLDKPEDAARLKCDLYMNRLVGHATLPTKVAVYFINPIN